MDINFYIVIYDPYYKSYVGPMSFGFTRSVLSCINRASGILSVAIGVLPSTGREGLKGRS